MGHKIWDKGSKIHSPRTCCKASISFNLASANLVALMSGGTSTMSASLSSPISMPSYFYRKQYGEMIFFLEQYLFEDVSCTGLTAFYKCNKCGKGLWVQLRDERTCGLWVYGRGSDPALERRGKLGQQCLDFILHGKILRLLCFWLDTRNRQEEGRTVNIFLPF